MSKIVLIIGLPASGKSFIAERLSQGSRFQRWVSTDRIRQRLFGDESVQGPWLQIWAQICAELEQAVADMVDVIYDATNAQRRRRRDLIAQVRGFGFQSVGGLWVNTPLEVCLARNERRSRQVPQGVILQMYRQLTDAPPSLNDGFDRLIEIQNI
ncbi:AAA family ATPase [Arthrospira platensis]|jgi:predicted kinase|uniref:AAA family ATPase n=1 Tax=Limnospira platensis NIES-46 TaxID=1236695 RepID=A0A5M3TAI8_LIMPL|nr:AAA family ATPase [Arthrospira platensis]AMW28232.1 AAA family ATPase [Arthrospira platensis YZ]KDR56855.1 ATPase AAA [Arthrospira platensis str. Paraca]MBD2711550.1 AAA family ATPase [Arthrospira platensis FACHB-835]MDF2209378.1 AAA family ATPase [Arthrospira platensis NCB002]MDT9184064.1 AAA family ATPase [Limnospira sp. PMC 289.06]MDT9311858.1 AAA family ATPase [Limnospira sp. Paracas R14]QQW31026.1 AAA family ATPase [Arthrospira sp. PCC 9108]BAI90096.1 hypothetical protein NIES39_D06